MAIASMPLRAFVATSGVKPTRAEGAEAAVEEDLGFAFFVAGQGSGVGDEVGEALGAFGVHAGREDSGGSSGVFVFVRVGGS